MFFSFESFIQSRKCMCVLTDCLVIQEQRVQWHSAENEWKETPQYFEQGQEHGHHQVRCLTFSDWSIMSVWEGLEAERQYQELTEKTVFVLILYLGFPSKEKSKPMKWKWTGESTQPVCASLPGWIKNDTDC